MAILEYKVGVAKKLRLIQFLNQADRSCQA